MYNTCFTGSEGIQILIEGHDMIGGMFLLYISGCTCTLNIVMNVHKIFASGHYVTINK
jgi:hypothetical protein